MAYMNQERKAAINAELKRVIPKSWKWSLAVRHHSTIVLTIAAAPVDLIAVIPENDYYKHDRGHCDLNPYHWRTHASDADAETVAIFEAIFAALFRGNHDRSDVMTDYFDVGWYVDVRIGQWNKPFVCTAMPQQVAA